MELHLRILTEQFDLHYTYKSLNNMAVTIHFERKEKKFILGGIFEHFFSMWTKLKFSQKESGSVTFFVYWANYEKGMCADTDINS